MTQIIVVDSSSIISIASNCLIGILSRLKQEFDVRFVVGEKVLSETVGRGLESKKYRLESFRVLELIKSGVIELIVNDDIMRLTNDIIKISNKCFKAKGSFINIIHWGESEMLAIAKQLGASFVMVDERTTRLLVENPASIREQQEKKLHTRVEMVGENVEKFKQLVGDLKVIRSTELCVFAFENGFFTSFEKQDVLKADTSKQRIIGAILWALKLHGCAISNDEMDSYINMFHQ